MWLLILMLSGSWAAYPQKNFPENLNASVNHWTKLVHLPEHPESIQTKFNDLSDRKLSNQEFNDLVGIFQIYQHQQTLLQNENLDFYKKYGYLGIYLSGLNPSVKGSFDRAGVWMLTYPDARRYGLVVNDFVDERHDFVKSTQAARLLFADLKEANGGNAEAAFVLGAAGRMRTNADMVSSVEADLTTLRILSKSFIKPTVLLAKSNWQSQQFYEPISMTVLLDNLEISEEEFRRRNPTLISNRLPERTLFWLPKIVDGHVLASESRQYDLDKKRELDSLMARAKSNIPNPETHLPITYRVKSGDVLGRIAERHGVSVSNIKKWNNLRSDRIDINQKLTIYYPKGKKAPVTTVPTAKPISKVVEEVKGKYTIYEVQAGDTLWAISKRFEGVKPEQIMEWNGISEAISIGQKLKIKTAN